MRAFSLLNGLESTSSMTIESSSSDYCNDDATTMSIESSSTVSAVTTITATTCQKSVDTFVSKINPTLQQLIDGNDTYTGAYYHVTHGIVYKYHELIPYNVKTGKQITTLSMKELIKLYGKGRMAPSHIVEWLNVNNFLTKSNRTTIQNSGGGNCWWKSISYYLWSDERKYLDLKEILLLFLTQDESQFALYFGYDKLEIRNNLVEFLIAAWPNWYEVILKTLLNPPKDDNDTVNGWAEAVWIDLLIMAVIWPNKRFCVLWAHHETEMLKIAIGERDTCYGGCLVDTTVIPEVIHELFAKIYKGTELVADLDNFDYDLVKDVNFILFTGQHYFVAPKK